MGSWSFTVNPQKRAIFLFLLAAISINAPLFGQTDEIKAAGEHTTSPVNLPVNFKTPTYQKSDSNQVYKINYLRTWLFNAAATIANGYAIPNIIKAKPALTDAELNALNPNAIGVIDRWALKQDPETREKLNLVSDHMLTVTSLSAAAIFFDKGIRKDWLKIASMYYETTFATFVTYSYSPFGPLFQQKVRPYSYYTIFPVEERRRGNQRNSFYSGHVANAAASTFFVAKVYSDYHPEIGNKKYLLYGLATLPPLAIGYLRVKSLFHFPSDCLVGLAIGAAYGIIIPETHRIKNRKLQIGVSTRGTNPELSMVWKIEKKTPKIL